MAGLPWFELDVDFHEHPKARALQAALREPLADAYLARLWAYCYRHATDRFPEETAALVVEEAARWRGKAGALFAAMLKVGSLDRDGAEVVVHGVDERLGPHLDHRTKAAARQRKRRAGLAPSQPDARDVTRDVTRESRPETDKDKDRDKDKIVSETASHSEQGSAGRLEAVASRLAASLGVPAVGIGRNRDRVEASFARYLDRGLEQELVDDCLALAREKHTTPSHLSWWVGWLDTVPDSRLDADARRRAEACQ